MASAAGGPKGLWTLVAAEAWRRTRRRLRAGPRYRWRFSGRTPERILIAPPDLRLADQQIAHEIYAGRFPLSGHVVETGGESPFQLPVADRGWLKSLHGFRWLRHMRAADTELAISNARALVADWITVNGGRIDGVAWDPGTVAKRIIAWLQHSNIVLQGADLRFHRMFLRSLAVQVRYLRWAAHGMPNGKEKLRARIALAFAALALPTSIGALRNMTRQLAEELDRQILPDGGHVSRNPLTIMELLADLIPLRRTYASQSVALPPELVSAVERMLPALRFFRHGDGSLARFNGMGATIQDRMAALLRYDETSGAPLLHAPHSGYDRLALGDTIVIADTGAPPPAELSNAASAGCLAFEMSAGRHCIIVNCGVDTYGPTEVRPLGRSTAAHSTATLNDTSQARFNHSDRFAGLLGKPLLGGPRNVSCQRDDSSQAQGFAAAHDAYVPLFGLYHERRMQLTQNGKQLSGIDRFYDPAGDPPKAGDRDAVAVRFHLHPEIELYEETDGLMLATRDGTHWRFSSLDVALTVDQSIFFAGLAGPRRSKQIVLTGRISDLPAIRWRFEQIAG